MSTEIVMIIILLPHEYLLAYSGCLLKDTNGPSCLGRAGFGSQLARVTALGSKVVVGNRELSPECELGVYM